MLPKFELYMPDTLEEACRLKAEGAEVVAGGTDVFVNMHGGKDRSGKVVDIKNIPALQGHTFDEAQGLDLGALTTHREIELWDVIKKHYRAMFEGCSRVGSVQIRTRGTLGGNICNGAPSADSIGPMLVHDARVVAAGPAGEREIPLHNFYLGLKKLDLRPDELLARIRAMTRKRVGQRTNRFTVGDLTLDTERRQAVRGGEEIPLLPKEFSILEYLVRNKEKVLSREQIEDQIWNYDYAGSSNNVDVYLSRLRKKIDGGREEKLIHTVRGMGWAIREPAAPKGGTR